MPNGKTETSPKKWAEMKAEYMAGGVSYRRLAEKHGVSENKIEKRALKEGWVELRRKTERKTAEEIMQTISVTTAKKRKLISGAVDRLIDKLVIAIDNTSPEDLSRQQSLVAILDRLQKINEYRSPEALREQRARIEALQRTKDGEQTKAIEISVLSGSEFGE